MKKNKLIVSNTLLSIGFIYLSSCAPTYIPNAINAPLMKNAGEVNAAVYAGTNGVDGQASVAIINHLGVMADYSYGNRTNTGTDSTGFRNHEFFEGGIGYFLAPLSKTTCFEVWGGYGEGNSAAKADKSGLYVKKNDIVSGNYSRYFLQVDYGLRTKKFEIGFAARYSYVNFSSYRNSNSITTYHGLDESYVQPTGFIRVGGKHIKFTTQMGLSVRTSFFNDEKPKFRSQPFYISFGLQATLNRKWED